MQITLNQLTFQTIIGILPEERITPQEVVLNLKITYTYTSNEFINYADVASFLEITMQHEKYLLIEDALHDLCEKLLTKFPLIEKMFPDLKTEKQQETAQKIIDGLSRNSDLQDVEYDNLVKQAEMFLDYAKKKRDSK